MIIIAKNITGSNVYINDLYGQEILAGDQIILTDLYQFSEITKSIDLKNLIDSGSVVINDGSIDLPTINGKEHVDEVSQYIAIKNLIDLNDVPDVHDDIHEHLLMHDGTRFTWIEHVEPGETSTTGVTFTMSDHASHDYVANGNNSYTSIRTFLFDGTSRWTPKVFSVIGSMASDATGYARIYDFTNNLQICEISFGYNNDIKGIYETSTLTNLPSEESIFELQTRTGSKGRDCRLHYMALY